jgi:hypothetical protein
MGATVAGEVTGLTDRAREAARAGARERATTLTGRSHWAERGGEQASGTRRRQVGPTGQRTRARGGGGGGGLLRATFPFLLF